MKLKDNTILVTGGSSGLGFEFAKALVSMGNTVIITGRSQERLETAKLRLPAVHIFRSDVSSITEIEKLHGDLLKEFPSLNVLINNAGVMESLNLNDQATTLSDVSVEIEANLLGPIRMVQKFLPQLKRVQNAAIINICSGLALIPFPISPIYGASKAGLHAYTKALRVQLQQSDVQVFEVLAPAAATPLNDKFLGLSGFDPKTLSPPGKLVEFALKEIEKDTLEIYPGAARLIKIASRVAPAFLFKQLSKVGEEFFTRK